MKTLVVNNRVFTIRSNLYDFLIVFQRRCQLVPGDTYVWIDRMCIDQRSTSERNHQVQLMGAIYKRAHQVLIWAGYPCDDRFPFDGVDNSGHMFPTDFLVSEIKESSVASSTKDVGYRVLARGEWVRQLLKRLVVAPYWQRRWVIQEVLLARKCSLLFGNSWQEVLRDYREPGIILRRHIRCRSRVF